jgi:hypothetical protein
MTTVYKLHISDVKKTYKREVQVTLPFRIMNEDVQLLVTIELKKDGIVKDDELINEWEIVN